MNLTLSIDEKVLGKARKVAMGMGLSLNEVVRRYLRTLAGESDSVSAFTELRTLFLEQGGHSKGSRFNREDLHRG
ncbi:MAG: hypothetical protein IPP78_07885 [Holophagaceae bacterium]|nr:hypothetical protein [Holophagaceae bacterium]